MLFPSRRFDNFESGRRLIDYRSLGWKLLRRRPIVRPQRITVIIRGTIRRLPHQIYLPQEYWRLPLIPPFHMNQVAAAGIKSRHRASMVEES